VGRENREESKRIAVKDRGQVLFTEAIGEGRTFRPGGGGTSERGYNREGERRMVTVGGFRIKWRVSREGQPEDATEELFPGNTSTKNRNWNGARRDSP